MMRIVLLPLLLLLIIFQLEARSHGIRRHQPGVLTPSGLYRISPKTGVRIALPSESIGVVLPPYKHRTLLFLAPEQLKWQAQDMGVLIHFNLATFIDVDGCSGQMVPNASLFNPSLLNTDNWVQTIIDFGAVYGVLVGKVKMIPLP